MDERELQEAMEIAVAIALADNDSFLVDTAADPMKAADAIAKLAAAVVKLGGNTIRAPRTSTIKGIPPLKR